MVGVGPVVVQAFPDAARAFRDVGLRRAAVVDLEVLVGAVAKKLRAARPKVGEPGDVLFGRRGGCLVQADRLPPFASRNFGILNLVPITPVATTHSGFFS